MKKKHKKSIRQQQPFRLKKVHVITAVSAILVIALVITSILIYNSIDKTVITVNGEKITQRELSRVMQEKEVDALNYFKTKYKADTSDKNFWFNTYGNENPIQYLKEISSEEAIRIKTQQIMAKELGLIDDISYAAFLKNFAAEYKRRQDPNEKVAGVRKITEMNYFDETFTALQDKLKDKLVEKKTIDISDKEALDYYNANKDAKFKKQDYLHVQNVTGDITKAMYDKGEKPDKYKDDIISKLNSIKAQIVSGGDPATVCSKASDDKFIFTFSDQVMDDEFISQDYLSYQIMSTAVKDLPVGQWKDAAQYENGNKSIVKLVERRDQGYLSFDDAKPQIKDVYLKQQKFDELVDKRVKEATIVKNDKLIQNTKVRSNGLY